MYQNLNILFGNKKFLALVQKVFFGAYLSVLEVEPF